MVDDDGVEKIDRKMVQSNIITGFRDDKKKGENGKAKKSTRRGREDSQLSNHQRLLKLQQQLALGGQSPVGGHFGQDSTQVVRLNEDAYKSQYSS